MSVIEFVPTTSALHLKHHADDPVAQSISLGLRLSSSDELRTADDRLLDLKWILTLYEGVVSNDHVKSCGAIGMLNYFPAIENDDWSNPESCALWAHLGAKEFALLKDVVLAGRLPTLIFVHANDLTYGWEPDGSGKIWDVTANKNTPLHQIEMTFAIAQSTESEDDEAAKESQRPVTAADLKAMERTMVAAINKALSCLVWWTPSLT